MGVNKLPIEKPTQILAMLCEVLPMRWISRVADVSINTVAKLLEQAEEACIAIHNDNVQSVKASRVQCDEIWSFCYVKRRNVATAKDAPEGAGDVWTWIEIDADTKLIVSYLVGGRDSEYAMEFMDDLSFKLFAWVLYFKCAQNRMTKIGQTAILFMVKAAFDLSIWKLVINLLRCHSGVSCDSERKTNNGLPPKSRPKSNISQFSEL